MKCKKIFVLACVFIIAFPVMAICQEQPLANCCWAKARDRAAAIQMCSRQIHDRGLQGRDLAGLYAGRGFAFVLSKQYPAAISDYDEALKLWPNSWSIYFGRAMAYALSGNMDRATDDFSEVVALNPQYLASIDERESELEALGGKNNADVERAYTLAFRFRRICRARPVVKQVCSNDLTGQPAETGQEVCMDCQR